MRRAMRPPVVYLRHRGLTSSDAVIASYPRSGSTWLTFMVLHLLRGDATSWSEADRMVPAVGDQDRCCSLLPDGGRLLRSHERDRPEYCRAVYIVRDPVEVAVSYYAYRKGLGEYRGDFGGFVEMWLVGTVDGYGPWDRHAKSWLQGWSRGGRLIITYDMLRRDPAHVLTEVAQHLRIETQRSLIDAAVEAHGVASMKRLGTDAFRDKRPSMEFVASRLREAISSADRQRIEARFGSVWTEVRERCDQIAV